MKGLPETNDGLNTEYSAVEVVVVLGGGNGGGRH